MSKEQEICINAEEIEDVISTLDKIMEDIFSTIVPTYSLLQRQTFYQAGKADEEIQTMLKSDYVDLGVVAVEGNYYGKLQMLGMYYGLVLDYARDALYDFKELDEKLADLYDSYVLGELKK